MDGAAHVAGGDSAEADRASSSASSTGSASRRSRPHRGIPLRRRRRPLSVRAGEGGGDGVQDLALPLGMSFAAVLVQRSAMTGPNMPITFNLVLLGGVCGFVGRFCVDTLGGDGNVWLVFWEILCAIHLLGNSYPSLLYRGLYGPISVTHRPKAVGLPYWVRRYIFYAVLSLILPCLAGLLPFASLSDWREHAVEYMMSRFTGNDIET